VRVGENHTTGELGDHIPRALSSGGATNPYLDHAFEDGPL
jgi:hypothetical protein